MYNCKRYQIIKESPYIRT